MAHFAKLDANNVVEQVIVVANEDTADSSGVETEAIGVAFCQKLLGGGTNWKQTSYNAADGKGFRGNYAGIGYTFMTGQATMGVASTDVFLPQQPFPSWTVGIQTACWVAPIAGPPDLTTAEADARKYYRWDESAYQADTASPKTVGWVLGG